MRTMEQIIAQRVEARKAIGHLESITEYFPVCADRDSDKGSYEAWSAKIEEFKKWLWDESPIA